VELIKLKNNEKENTDLPPGLIEAYKIQILTYE